MKFTKPVKVLVFFSVLINVVVLAISGIWYMIEIDRAEHTKSPVSLDFLFMLGNVYKVIGLIAGATALVISLIALGYWAFNDRPTWSRFWGGD